MLLLFVILSSFFVGLLINQLNENNIMSALFVWAAYSSISFFLQVFLIPGTFITNILTGLGLAVIFFIGITVIKVVKKLIMLSSNGNDS